MEKTIDLLLRMFGTTDFLFFSLLGLLIGYLAGIHHLASTFIRKAFDLYTEPLSMAPPLRNKKEFAHTVMFVVAVSVYFFLYTSTANFNHSVFMIGITLLYTVSIGYIVGTLNTQNRPKLKYPEEKVIDIIKKVTRISSESHLSYWYGIFGLIIGTKILSQENMLTSKVFMVTFCVSLLMAEITRRILADRETPAFIDLKEPLIIIFGIVCSIFFLLQSIQTQYLSSICLGIGLTVWGGTLTMQSVLFDLFTENVSYTEEAS